MSAQPAAPPLAPFERAAVAQSDRGKRVKQRDYLAEGRIPVIDQGQSPVGGYTNDEDFAFIGELPVVLFGDHTRAVKLVDQRFAVGADGIKIFRPAEGVRAKYLYYWMKSAPLPDRGYGRHYQYLRELSLPLPPPKQQDEIVAELEKQFSRLDEAVANLKRVKANLEKFRASVYQAAVEGGLLVEPKKAEGRARAGAESPGALLARVSEVHRMTWKGRGKYRTPEKPPIDSLPPIPAGWVWATWGQVGHSQNGRAFPSSEYTAGGVRLLRPGNMHQSGAVVWDEGNTRYLPERYATTDADLIVEGGELVMNLTAQSLKDEFLGRVCLTRPGERCLLNQRLARLTPCGFSTRYALVVFKSRWFRAFVDRLNTGSLIQHMFTSQLEGFPFPLPPLEEQHRIVAEVDRRLSIVREVEAEVDANLKRAQALQQTVLARAFSSGSLGTRLESAAQM